MARVMSVGRVELIEAIQKHAPNSIYELARLLERDFANVHRDVKTLSEIGLPALEEAKSGNRERLRPMMLFDKIVREMELPKKRAV
jgi:predicted transcriptional regulator